MAACATVYRSEGQVKYADIGVWEQPPIVRPDGTTNGHMVVWTPSFQRLIDQTVVQDPTLLRLARREVQWTLPVILRVDDPAQLAGGQTVVTPRGPYLVSWTLLPDWTDTMAPVLDGAMGQVVEYGALAVAHDVVDLLRATGQLRDLRRLPQLYPALGGLLAGTTNLPPLGELPPEAARLTGR